jgi:Uma2 family endonuclease
MLDARNETMSTTDSGRQLTYTDFLAFPDDGQRHELLGGVHVVSAAPLAVHQVALTAILVSLDAQISGTARGIVAPAPLAVRLSDEDGVQPDIVVVLRGSRAQVRRRDVDGPPDLVVEILSPSTRRLDLGLKRDAYERLGVGEYWVVDLDARQVRRFVRTGDRFLDATVHTDRVRLAALPDVAVELGPVWARVDDLD